MCLNIERFLQKSKKFFILKKVKKKENFFYNNLGIVVLLYILLYAYVLQKMKVFAFSKNCIKVSLF